jgi:hypothetical protein
MSFCADYFQMTMIFQGLELGNLSLESIVLSSEAGAVNMGAALRLHPMRCVLPGLDFAGRWWITLLVPPFFWIIMFVVNCITLYCRGGFAAHANQMALGESKHRIPTWLRRKMIQSAIVAGQLLFAPLFQHSLTLFHFKKVGTEYRLWAMPDMRLDESQRLDWIPMAIAGIIIAWMTPVLIFSFFSGGWMKKGRRWMFEGEKGFWTFGAL